MKEDMNASLTGLKQRAGHLKSYASFFLLYATKQRIVNKSVFSFISYMLQSMV